MVATTFGYEGKHGIGTETDGANTLMLMGARLYNPVTGRFLQVDPVFGGSANAYDYVGQDPLNAGDLDGECGFCWSTVTKVWNDTGGKIVHVIATHTVGVCLNASGGFAVYGGASGCVALVGGRVTLFGTLAGGGASPTASVTSGLLISNAKTPKELSKWFGFAGGSTDFGPSVGDDVSFGQSNRAIWENQVTGGVGVDFPIPFEYHGGASYTWVWAP